MNSPVPRARRERSPAQTRRAVLDAAESCFREFGFDATRGIEIARRAGVSEGTVFQRYDSKLGLLTAVTCAFYEAVQTDAEAVMAAEVPAAERLRMLVDGWAARIEGDWPLIRVFALRSQLDPQSKLAAATTPLLRRYTNLFLAVINELKAEGALSADAHPTMIRNMIFGLLEHTARGQDVAGRPVRVRETAQQALDHLLFPRPSGATGTELRAIEKKLDEVLHRLDKRPS